MTGAEEKKLRAALQQARRIVVKVGTRVLMGGPRGIQASRVEAITSDIARLHRTGHQVVLVSSGAIGCGMAAMGLHRRPQNLPELQMAAAIGQTHLMATYQQFLNRHRILAAQVLLTHDDLRHRQRHLNARNTFMALLRSGVVPVVNENDVVAVEEIKVGDNDFLAALVAMLVSADLLVLLTTTNGVRQPVAGGRTARIPVVRQLTAELRRIIGNYDRNLSVGGMETKLEAALMAASVGIPTVIADGRRPGTLLRICGGESVGTLIPARVTRRPISARKQWIAFFNRPQGTVVVDPGARDALRFKGKSLLPIGIREVRGQFPAGAVVDICDTEGNLIGRGLTDYSSDQIQKIMGKPSSAIADILGSHDYDEVIHRDNMILFESENGGAK